MADISGLQNLQAGEPLDWDQYADAREMTPPPPKGRYMVRATDKFTFSATKLGYLQAQVDPVVVGPTNEGYVIRFARVSAKPFKRRGTTVSQAGDYLRATGSQARPRTPEELAAAIELTAGAPLQVEIDWEAYDAEGPFVLKGMENFPLAENGQHMPWAPHPTKRDPVSGEPMMVRANVKIERFVPQGE